MNPIGPVAFYAMPSRRTRQRPVNGELLSDVETECRSAALPEPCRAAATRRAQLSASSSLNWTAGPILRPLVRP